MEIVILWWILSTGLNAIDTIAPGPEPVVHIEAIQEKIKYDN